MSDSHSTEETTFIKTPTQLLVVIVLAFIIPIAGIFTIIHFVVGGEKSRATPAMSDAAIAERVKPVGSVPADAIEKGPSPLVPAPVVVAPVAAADAGKTAAPSGKAVYDATCTACHAANSPIPGVPKLGDKAAWAPRIATGMAALLTSVTNGKNAMPAKGGNPSLTDTDLKAAVEYMVSQSK